MQQTMKALVYEGPKTMNVRQLPVPVPKEGELLIRVECAGICGSELSGYLGQSSIRKAPLVMGHEFSGKVEAAGSKLSRFQKGDRVTCNPQISCGECRECIEGKAHICQSRQLLSAHKPGAFAEYVIVPEKNTYILPDHISADTAAFTEPFAVAIHICRLMKVSASDRLLVIGAGPIGLLVMKAAQIMGVENVVIKDIQRERLEIAESLGGIAVSSNEDLANVMPQGGFDVVVDAVGREITRIQCVESVRQGGRIAFSGHYDADSKLPVSVAIRKEAAMHGVYGFTPYEFELSLEWLSKGKADLLPWTRMASLEEGEECFQQLLSGAGKISKVLFKLD